MAITQKDQVGVYFNGSGILAETASLSTKTTLQPIQILGRKGVINQSPNAPLQSDFSLSYPIEGNDPILSHVLFLRTGYQNFHFAGQSLSIAGITGNCYIKSYNLRIIPNKIIRADASFSSYDYLSGTIQNKPTNIVYNSLGGTGLLHANSSYITSSTNYLNSPTYEFSYSFGADWSPVYSIGSKTPTQINLIGGKESFSFVKNYYSGVQLSGQTLTGVAQMPERVIRLNELSYLISNTSYNNYTLDVSGAIHSETRLEEQDGVIKTTIFGENYF